MAVAPETTVDITASFSRCFIWCPFDWLRLRLNRGCVIFPFDQSVEIFDIFATETLWLTIMDSSRNRMRWGQAYCKNCPRRRTKGKCITYFTYWTYINIKVMFPLFEQKLCLFDAFWATDKWWCAIFHPPPAGGDQENVQIAKYKKLKNRKCYSSAPRGDHEREQNVQRNIFKVMN